MRLLGLLLLISIIAGAFAYRGWTPVDIKDIPRAEAGDVIQVIELQAPLFFDKYGRLLENFHLFHSGIGFMNMRTGVNWTVEYDALPSVFAAVVPTINKTEDGTVTLDWHNKGGAMLYLSINQTYWISHQTFVGKINGTIHNNFLEWLKDANTTHPHYNLFSVFDQWNEDGNKRKLLLPSFTCFDLVYEIYDVLYKLGARFTLEKSKRNFINFYAKATPVSIDFKDPKHHDRILHFYEVIEGKAKMMNFAELLVELLYLLEGEAYLRKDDDYYFMALHSPSLNWKYSYSYLPGHEQSRQAIADMDEKSITIVKEPSSAASKHL